MFAISSSYQRRSTAARSLAVSAAHAGNAWLAASMARRVSAAPISGTVPIGSRVAGFTTWCVAPLMASTHLPPMKARLRSRSGSRNFMWRPSPYSTLDRLAAGHMAAEEVQSACARQRGDLRVVGLALLAVETVARPLVDKQRRLRVRRLDALDVAERDAAVLPAVVIHDRAPGFLLEIARDLAVIDHRAGEGQLAGGKIGQGSAPAVADGRRPAGVFHHGDRGREVAQRIFRHQLLGVAAPLLHVGGGVAELDAAAHPVEEARRDGRVAVGGEAVAHFADVAVDPEDLLDHQHCAARAAGGGGEPRLKLVAVAGHDGGVLAHHGPRRPRV